MKKNYNEKLKENSLERNEKKKPFILSKLTFYTDAKDNINAIVKKINVPKKLGLLSLDIDGVDYWILNNLSFLEPSIVVCEYNSLFGQKKSVTVPYKKNFIRSEEHYSNLYYGASINAFIDLMRKKTYLLLAL